MLALANQIILSFIDVTSVTVDLPDICANYHRPTVNFNIAKNHLTVY